MNAPAPARAFPQTPFYVKRAPDDCPPDDERMAYLLTRDGLFRHRSTALFTASVPCGLAPELAPHRADAVWRRPLPQALVERAVGFFEAVHRRDPGAEAILLLGWSPQAGYEAIVPAQTATLARDAHTPPQPVGVRYETPTLPPGMVLAGDLHSHAHQPAYESEVDHADVRWRSGLYLVIGRVHQPVEPPDLFACLMVDGHRFPVPRPATLFEGYTRRRTDFPPAWLDRVRVEVVAPRRGWRKQAYAETWQEGGHPYV